MARITRNDIETMARTIWGEARGEGAPGMEAVAHVIKNRTRDPRWPGSFESVCLQPRQFSCWNENDPNRAQLVKLGNDDLSFLRAQAIALDVITLRLADSTYGANHYLTVDLFRSAHRPAWADPETITARIGRHVFFEL